MPPILGAAYLVADAAVAGVGAGVVGGVVRALAFTATQPSMPIPAPIAVPFAVWFSSAIMLPSSPPTMDAVTHSADLASSLFIPPTTSVGVGSAGLVAQPVSSSALTVVKTAKVLAKVVFIYSIHS